MCIRGPKILSNTELWATTVILQSRERNWRWIGHVLSKGDENVEKQALDWNPQGVRRGTLKHTWKKILVEEAGKCGKTWGEVKCLAGYIVRWRCFSNGLCS